MRISDWSSDVCSSDLWYTEILAPLTKAGGGTLYAAAPWERGLNRVKAKQAENADVYGALKLAEFPNAGTNPKVPRSEEPRVGKECDSTCTSRWSPSH